MSLLLYSATALLLLILADRFVTRVAVGHALALFLLPFCFVGRALVTGGVYGPIDIAYATAPLLGLRDQMGVSRDYSGILGDVAYQMIPWRKAVQWAISQGEWPLWNPFILSGDILAASAQPAAYSPFTLLAILLPIGPGLTYSAAITFFIAGLGAFLFAREIGCTPVASLIAAAGWMYSAAIAFFVLWPLGLSWAYLPFVLAGARRVVHDPSVRSFAILCTALTLMVLAGHPETVLHVVAVGCAYGIVELLAIRRRAGRVVAAAVAAGIVALMICAVYLLPLLEAVPQTMEHQFRIRVFAEAPRGAPAPAVLARIATDLLPFMHFREWRVEGIPPFSPESGGVGSIVLACALYALIAVRSRQTWFFGALVLFGLLAGSEWKPLARLLQQLPLFDIALNGRFVFAAAFALTLLAALGVDAIAGAPSRRPAAIVLTTVLLLIAAAAWFIVSRGLAGPHTNLWGEHKLAAEIGLLAVAAALVALPTPVRLLPPLLLGLVLVQRTVSEGGIYPVYPAAAAYPPVPLLQSIKKPEEPFRVVGFNLEFIPGTNALYELEDPRGYQAMTFVRYRDTYQLWCEHQPVWFNRVIDLTRPFLSFLNVRYAIAGHHVQPPDGWRLVTEDHTGRLFENMRVIDRVFLPRRLRIGLSAPEALFEMAHATDFHEQAWIAADTPPHDRTNATGRLKVRRQGTTYFIDATMDDDGWIVVSEKAWKGWRAYIDGRRVQTTIANIAFVSVFVPRGTHQIRLVYLPTSFVNGRGISLGTLGLLLVFGVVRRYRLRQP